MSRVDTFANGFTFVSQRFVQRLAGLTDGELLWEPAPNCWTVREVDGTTRADTAWPPPDPAPITTIAWRIAHIADGLSRHNLRPLVRLDAPARPPVSPPRDAEAAQQFVESAIRDWREDLAALSDDDLARLLGPKAGPYAGDDVAAFLLHIHTEFVHHSAEIALLRDLYGASTSPRLA